MTETKYSLETLVLITETHQQGHVMIDLCTIVLFETGRNKLLRYDALFHSGV
jgi:hypothetical protein